MSNINTKELFSATLNNQFIVWDAMMSSGKTQTIIDYMLQEHNKKVFGVSQEKFIYISPYLSEAHRIAATVCVEGDEQQRPRRCVEGDTNYNPMLCAKEQHVYYDESQKQAELRFCHPSNSNKEGSKQTGLVYLMENDANIVSTHSLFKQLSTTDLPNCGDYTLIIDEALDALVLDNTLTKAELEKFIKIDILSIDEDTHQVRFNKENFGRANVGEDTTEGTRFEELANLCNKGLVYKTTKGLVCKFDASLLHKFKRVIIMTYNYKGSIFDLVLQQQGINPHVCHFGKTVEDIKHLINVCQDEKMNSVGVPRNPATMKVHQKYQTLTSTYYKKSAKGEKVAYPEITKFFYNKLFNMWGRDCKVPVERRLWTSYKEDAVAIGKGGNRTNRFGNSWIPFNIKATNDYDTTTDLAFLVNPYIEPDFVSVASWSGIEFSQDHFALNTLIQWLFRSAIRKGQPINLYLPSERMRTLLDDWLNGKVITYANIEG